MLIHGIDFTSAPGTRKAITVASATLAGRTLRLGRIEALDSWQKFEAWLMRPGPWIGGFDFPFGLPRVAVDALGWPQRWDRLVRHCAGLGRERWRTTLDAYRESRPMGDRYAHRRGDRAAGSHSALKLVNPPVALMFLEGAARLLAAGVDLPGLHRGDTGRIALEAYPGHAVRSLYDGKRAPSYKNDARAKQTPAQRGIRCRIVRRIVEDGLPCGVRLAADPELLDALVADASGDRLDAALCAMQAAAAWQERGNNFGLPLDLDPLEGWIATVPGPA